MMWLTCSLVEVSCNNSKVGDLANIVFNKSASTEVGIKFYFASFVSSMSFLNDTNKNSRFQKYFATITQLHCDSPSNTSCWHKHVTKRVARSALKSIPMAFSWST